MPVRATGGCEDETVQFGRRVLLHQAEIGRPTHGRVMLVKERKLDNLQPIYIKVVQLLHMINETDAWWGWMYLYVTVMLVKQSI